jgi:hypothetical protein
MRQANFAVVVVTSALLSIAGLASAEMVNQASMTSTEAAPQMCADQSSFVVAAAEKEQAPVEKEQAPSGDVQERAIPRTGLGSQVPVLPKKNIVSNLTENECKKLGCSVSVDSGCPVSNIGIERLRCTCSTGSACIDKGNY